LPDVVVIEAVCVNSYVKPSFVRSFEYHYIVIYEDELTSVYAVKIDSALIGIIG
jgi:hypothetical protein